jgi:hypothetical protein
MSDEWAIKERAKPYAVNLAPNTGTGYPYGSDSPLATDGVGGLGILCGGPAISGKDGTAGCVLLTF